MTYADYLRAMLSPLKVYNLDTTSFSGAEVEAMGNGMEDCWQSAQTGQKEMILMTAGDYGLTMWESVFPYRAAVETDAQRLAAIQGFMAISGDSFTYEAICNCLAACGVTCSLVETDTPGVVEISFDGLVGEPDNYDTVQAICEMILPCHLQINYIIVYLTWGGAIDITWGDAADYTWHELKRLEV